MPQANIFKRKPMHLMPFPGVDQDGSAGERQSVYKYIPGWSESIDSEIAG